MANVIIELTFPNVSQTKREKYKDFALELTEKQYSSRLGCYSPKEKKIEISAITKECRHDVLITFIHELSHHIEFVNTKETGHQKSFYDIHKRLLKTAVDLEYAAGNGFV